MPEIGETLREARMRARIDISDIEAETKIRAKYLRALENEEWDLLPGDTFVKTFLRTYAAALGLDGKLLVEEYRRHYERRSDAELPPIAARPQQRDRRDRRGRKPRGGVPRGAIVGLVVAALLITLFALGRNNGDGEGGGGGGGDPTNTIGERPQTTTAPRTTPAGGGAGPGARPLSGVVSLQIVPIGAVWVCLLDASNRRLIAARELQRGQRSRTYRSSRFRLTLGNGDVDLRINGRLRAVPTVSDSIGYEITRNGRRVLPASRRPACG